MQRKKSEEEFGTMMRRYHYFTHKWRDRGYVSCPHCHIPVKTCPRCKQDMLLPKAQTYPDFLIAYHWGDYEVKYAADRFSWKEDISPNQYRVMSISPDAWLFLEIGDGRAPDGRSAFLVPWQIWLGIEHELEARKINSIVFARNGTRGKSPIANELLEGYRMEWLDGGWVIPGMHVFWETHRPIEEGSYETD